jgi:hypothetical protein
MKRQVLQRKAAERKNKLPGPPANLIGMPRQAEVAAPVNFSRWFSNNNPGCPLLPCSVCCRVRFGSILMSPFIRWKLSGQCGTWEVPPATPSTPTGSPAQRLVSPDGKPNGHYSWHQAAVPGRPERSDLN